MVGLNPRDHATLRLFAFVGVMASFLPGLGAYAQQTPPAQSPPMSTAQHTQHHPLDDVLLQETDEDDVPTSLFSRVAFEYDHASFSGGADNDRFRIKGQQAFGPGFRIGFGYEIPFIDAHRTGAGQDASGLGDIKLIGSAVLGDTARFKHAAVAEFTFPSAANEVVGLGQTIVKAMWSFSTPLGERTALSGILGYNKAVNTNRGQLGMNSFEPEAVLAHTFRSRVAAYLDYDTYEDFNADRFGQTLKAGLSLGLDARLRWNLSP